MIVGTHNAVNKTNLVLVAGRDLELTLQIKRERQQMRQFSRILGRVEKIIFENDKDCALDSPQARRIGRQLYWPEAAGNGPWLALSRPEEDLIFMNPLRLPMPDVPDATDVVENPYKVDMIGNSHLGKDETPEEARKVKQRLEEIASSKHRNFLVFHPVAQIILLMNDGSGTKFGTIGSHRMPLSSLSGFDGRKMALLIDPYTGEAVFSGGRFSISVQ